MSFQATTDELLHGLARALAGRMHDVDKKQLRFTEIVACAKMFYPRSPYAGVAELINSCSKSSPLYVKGAPMWETLKQQYGWMVEQDRQV